MSVLDSAEAFGFSRGPDETNRDYLTRVAHELEAQPSPRDYIAATAADIAESNPAASGSPFWIVSRADAAERLTPQKLWDQFDSVLPKWGRYAPAADALAELREEFRAAAVRLGPYRTPAQALKAAGFDPTTAEFDRIEVGFTHDDEEAPVAHHNPYRDRLMTGAAGELSTMPDALRFGVGDIDTLMGARWRAGRSEGFADGIAQAEARYANVYDEGHEGGRDDARRAFAREVMTRWMVVAEVNSLILSTEADAYSADQVAEVARLTSATMRQLMHEMSTGQTNPYGDPGGEGTGRDPAEMSASEWLDSRLDYLRAWLPADDQQPEGPQEAEAPAGMVDAQDVLAFARSEAEGCSNAADGHVLSKFAEKLQAAIDDGDLPAAP